MTHPDGEQPSREVDDLDGSPDAEDGSTGSGPDETDLTTQIAQAWPSD